MRHIVNYSGGKASWRAAERVVERYGVAATTLLFADAIIEDEDSYRFLIESAAHVLRIKRPVRIARLCKKALSLPTVESGEMQRRKWALLELARDAMRAIPGLVWITEGRDPWDVFEDVRFIGNSRVDPCSRTLKRRFLDAYFEKHCDPSKVTRHFGLDANEGHRLATIRARLAKWTVDAPLLWSPPIFKEFISRDLDRAEIKQPRLYDWGFQHGNCGGMCVKAGQAQFGMLLAKKPDRFAYHEGREQHILQILGRDDVGVMRDRKGNESKSLTLKNFRLRQEAGQGHDRFDWGGCGCAAE